MFNTIRFNKFANWLAGTVDVDYAEGLPARMLENLEIEWKQDLPKGVLKSLGY